MLENIASQQIKHGGRQRLHDGKLVKGLLETYVLVLTMSIAPSLAPKMRNSHNISNIIFAIVGWDLFFFHLLTVMVSTARIVATSCCIWSPRVVRETGYALQGGILAKSMKMAF
jgi:hypothetical protein